MSAMMVVAAALPTGLLALPMSTSFMPTVRAASFITASSSAISIGTFVDGWNSLMSLVSVVLMTFPEAGRIESGSPPTFLAMYMTILARWALSRRWLWMV